MYKKNIYPIFIFGAAGVSGFYTMSVELLGGRILAPFFGSSIFVWGAVISVLMTFLAVGYLIGGRLSTQNPSIKTLATLLAIESLCALPLLQSYKILDPLANYLPDPRWGALVASTVLFSSTILLAGTIYPYAMRLLIADVESAGKSAGIMSFVSTLGSAAGTITTSFYLVLYFDINDILLGLMSLLLLWSALLIAIDPTAKEVPHAHEN